MIEGDNPAEDTVAVLGAGNGGLAMAGALALKGYRVRLWNRSASRLAPLLEHRTITLWGAIEGEGVLEQCTTDIRSAVSGARAIYVVVTADAHDQLAEEMAPHLESGQVVILNPGRTGGALAIRAVFDRFETARDVIAAEAQSLVFACRADGARVRIIGAKAFVPFAAYPGSQTEEALSRVTAHFSCFHKAPSVLHTGMENVGAMFHPAIVLFNAAAIERGHSFFFYQDMTPAIANFLEALDRERLAVAAAYGLESHSIFEWIKLAYPSTVGDTLCERLRNNPAYHEILSPVGLDSRLLTEDVPTGLVPLASLGKAAGVPMPLTTAVIALSGHLLGRDFVQHGRTMERLGLGGLTPEQILRKLESGAAECP